MEERRYYGFDALRGGMMMLGILLHGATFYLASPPPTMPMLADRNTSYLMDLVFHFIHSFRMPVFFVMAGFFASLLVEKRGQWGTLKNRAARVLAPLVVALFTVLPLTLILVISFLVSVRYGTHDLIPERSAARGLLLELVAKNPEAARPSPMHLWFLIYLCYFYLLIPVAERLSKAVKTRGERWSASAGSAWVFFGLCALTAALLWPFRGGQVHEGFLYFTPHLPSLLYYGAFFLLGYVLNGAAWIRHLRLGHPGVYLAVGLASFPVAIYVSDIDQHLLPFAADVHLFSVLINALCTWAWIYFFTAAALKYFDRPSSWALYVSQSSYWVFLVHMPLLGFICWAMAPQDWPAPIKFAIAVSFTTVCAFASYHYLVQRSWISAFLNGRRFNMDWPWRSQAVRRD